MARTPDAFDAECAEEYGDRDENEVRCKACGARDLFWEEARGEHNRKCWVLVTGEGDVHRCPAYRRVEAKLDDFPVCEPCTATTT